MNQDTKSASGPDNARLAQLINGVLTGITFWIVGLIVNMRSFAEAIFPHISTSSTSVELKYLSQSRPIPHLLDWSYGTLERLLDLKEMSAPLLLFGTLVLAFILLITAITVINPTFHPFSRRHDSSPIEETAPADSETTLDPPNDEAAVLDDAASEETVPEVDVPDHEVPVEATPDKATAQQAKLSQALAGSLHLDGVHVEQAIRIFAIVGIPFLVVWYITGGSGSMPGGLASHVTSNNSILWKLDLIRCVAAGIALFAGFSLNGIAGMFGILHQAYQTDHAITPGRPALINQRFLLTLIQGAVFGAALWELQRFAPHSPDDAILAKLHALGTFTTTNYDLLLRPYVYGASLTWLGCGILLYGLGKPGLNTILRLVLVAPVLACGWSAHRDAAEITDSALARRYDLTPAILATAPAFDIRRPDVSVPQGEEAGILFGKSLGIKSAASTAVHGKDFIVFHPQRTFVVEAQCVTDDGLIAERSQIDVVKQFLQTKKYRTALSWVGIKYLFNQANLDLDSTAAIRTGLDDLEFCPHVINTSETTRDMLYLCSASPANIKLMDEYADSRHFTNDTRGAMRMIGSMYRRFGEPEKALTWFKKADMPSSFLERVRNEPPIFHNGKVTGKLIWNGKPLSGVRVGVVPQRLNGLTKELEFFALRYSRELFSEAPDPSPYFGVYHPRPFHLRWITGGVTTGADGSFAVEHLTEGEYFLVCSLPDGTHLTVPIDSHLAVHNSPPAFTLNYKAPAINLGEIGFSRQ